MTNQASQTLTTPATFAMAARAAALKAQGRKILNLSIGEPDFPTPDNIKAAAQKAIQDNHSYYTPTGGLPVLKEAIRGRLKRDLQLEYALDEVMAGTGGKQMLYNFFEVMLDPGDEVLLPDPSWVSYKEQVLWSGGTPVMVPTTPESGFALSAEALECHLSDRTKIVLINSPSNPSGGMIPEAELKKIGELCLKRGLFVLSDDVYECFSFDEQVPHVLALWPELKDQCVLVNSVSKSYAMTGWRLGYAAGPAEIIDKMQKCQALSTSNPCTVSQMAAIEALMGPQESVERMRLAFKARRDRAVDLLQDSGRFPFVRPQGAFYIMVDLRSMMGPSETDLDLSLRLLEEQGIAVVPGSAFGEVTRGWVRLSIASPLEVIEAALQRLLNL